MGAYMSEPVTEKESMDGANEFVSFGASSMQGWRMSQEDAHNCLPELGAGCSLFAVYDGHGGCEVARHTAGALPQLVRQSPLLQRGRVRAALRHVFMRYDATLTRPDVIARLKEIAARDGDAEAPEGSDDEAEDCSSEVHELYHEAHMPLDELLSSRYSGAVPDSQTHSHPSTPDKQQSTAPVRPSGQGVGGGGGSSSQLARVRATMKAGTKPPVSPFLRSKQNLSDAKVVAAPAADGHVKCDDEKTDGDVQKCLSAEMAQVDKDAQHTQPKESVKTEATDGDVTNGVTNGVEHGTGDVIAAVDQAAASAAAAEDGDGDKTAETAAHVNGSGGGGGGGGSEINGADSATVVPPAVSTPPPVKGPRPGSDKTPLPSQQQPALPAAAGALRTPRATRRQPPRRAAAAAGLLLEDEEAEEDEEDEDVEFDLSNGDQSTVVTDPDDEDDDCEDDDDDDDCENAPEENTSELGSEVFYGTEDPDDEDDGEEEEDEEDGLAMGDEESSDFMMDMKNEPGSDSGCTASLALIYGRHLFVANIGDSRCVLSRGGRALDMSEDHKPEDEPERQRIETAGGRVTMDGRVNGGLNLSRAFGDHAYKTNSSLPADRQMISAFPDVRHAVLQLECDDADQQDQFLVVACDGIWNSMTSQQVVDFVSGWLNRPAAEQLPLSAICEKLFDECLAPDSKGDGTGCDNMTCIIVKFLSPLHNRPPPYEPVDEAHDVSSSDSEDDEGGAPSTSKTDTKPGAPSPDDAAATTEPSAKRPPSDDDASASSRCVEQPPEKRARTE